MAGVGNVSFNIIELKIQHTLAHSHKSALNDPNGDVNCGQLFILH